MRYGTVVAYNFIIYYYYYYVLINTREKAVGKEKLNNSSLFGPAT